MSSEKDLKTVAFSSLKAGMSGTVSSFSKQFPNYRKKLMAMGLTPGTPFTVVRAAPFGDPVEIMVRGTMISLRRNEADAIAVALDK